MGRVSGADLRKTLEFLSAARIGTAEDPFPRPTLIALRDLVGADQAEYYELRRADRATLALSESHHVVGAPGSDDAMLAFSGQNPLGWRRWLPAHGARRLSGEIPRRRLQRLGFHGEFLAPNRLRDAIKVWLASSPESVACIQLWRYDGDFTRREQDMLGVLQQDLVRLRDAAIAGVAGPPSDRLALTPRQAEVLLWAIRGYSRAEIAARVGSSARTVAKHLEHAYEALGVHSRSQAIERILLSGPLEPGLGVSEVRPTADAWAGSRRATPRRSRPS